MCANIVHLYLFVSLYLIIFYRWWWI